MTVLNFVLGNECTCVRECKETHVRAYTHAQLERKGLAFISECIGINRGCSGIVEP